MLHMASMPRYTFTISRYAAFAALSIAVFSAPHVTLAQTAPAHTLRHVGYAVHPETLDQRISALHTSLKITPAEEPDWIKVADVMRRNEAEMKKLVAARRAQVPHELSAVDDLKTYARFTQAHVDGLKDLIGAFEHLYATMPEDQKFIADHTFAKFSHERAPMQHTAPAHG